jgi:hypothetical protein
MHKYTRKSLWLDQAPAFNFELNEDQVLAKALESGFVTLTDETSKNGYKVYSLNENYFNETKTDGETSK